MVIQTKMRYLLQKQILSDPANPYSISKVGHDLMSQYYHKAYGMKIITTRMFSHEGARRGKQFNYPRLPSDSKKREVKG